MIGQCRFEYRTQPSSSTIFGCNPYQGNFSQIKILLTCTVRRQINVTDEFEIKWFRQNTNGEVENLGQGDTNQALGTDWASTYPRLYNQQYNPSFGGKYWCQVINTTADPDQPLMRSNVFTLLPPDNYTGSTCSGIDIIKQHIKNVTCADQPVHSAPHDTSVVIKTTDLSYLG